MVVALALWWKSDMQKFATHATRGKIWKNVEKYDFIQLQDLFWTQNDVVWVAEANELFACLMKVPINFWRNSYLFDKKDYFSSTKRWWWTPGQGWVQRMYCSRRGSVMTRQLWPRLDDSKGGVIGKGSSVINEAVHFGKRKRDESGSGGMVAKKRCFNQ